MDEKTKCQQDWLALNVSLLLHSLSLSFRKAPREREKERGEGECFKSSITVAPPPLALPSFEASSSLSFFPSSHLAREGREKSFLRKRGGEKAFRFSSFSFLVAIVKLFDYTLSDCALAAPRTQSGRLFFYLPLLFLLVAFAAFQKKRKRVYSLSAF